MATCTCDCCNPDTPTTLNYTTKEINQILADGVINASVRYAPVGQNYLQLTLADALALVPDKERTTVRILTFLNKDTQPKPEVWIYFGTDILTWSDATKWVELPIPDPGKLSKYLTSDIVDGIQVVENAPGVEDNILYFEYEPIPDTATYGFQIGFESTPKAEVSVVANVTLKTMLIGENGLDGVVCIFGVTEKPSEAATVTYKATDSLGQEHTFVNSGTWGPPEGFNMPAYIFPGDPSKLDNSASSTHITSILGTAIDLLDAFNNGRVFISKTVTFNGVQVPSDITYSLLKSIDPDNPTIFQIIMSTVVWGHYIEITIDFENNEYQAISNTINGIIGVNNTGTTN